MSVDGYITKFDERSWWGEVVIITGETFHFHGTTVNGWRNQIDLNNRYCKVVFNRDGELFDIRICDAI